MPDLIALLPLLGIPWPQGLPRTASLDSPDRDHTPFPVAPQRALDHPDGVPGLLGRDRHRALPQDRTRHPLVERLVGARHGRQPAAETQPAGIGGQGAVPVVAVAAPALL